MIEGPFVLASGFSLADIATIPWLLRMDALKQYKGIEIPKTDDYLKLRLWIQNCKERRSVTLMTPRIGLEQNCFQYTNCG